MQLTFAIPGRQIFQGVVTVGLLTEVLLFETLSVSDAPPVIKLIDQS
jgi:hypothetical protein